MQCSPAYPHLEFLHKEYTLTVYHPIASSTIYHSDTKLPSFPPLKHLLSTAIPNIAHVAWRLHPAIPTFVLSLPLCGPTTATPKIQKKIERHYGALPSPSSRIPTFYSTLPFPLTHLPLVPNQQTTARYRKLYLMTLPNTVIRSLP